MRISSELLKINFSRGRKGAYPVNCVVIHVTEGSAASVRSWFNNPAAKVSAHYMVQRDGAIVNFVREDDTAWANGRVDKPTAKLVRERITTNPNDWTISIECEGTGKEELTDPQRGSLLFLIKDICERKRIPLSRRHIIRHQEIYSLKTCPGIISVDRIVKQANGIPVCP